MPLTQIDSDGSIRTLSSVTQVDIDGSLRVLKEIWQNDANNVPRLIFSSQTLKLSPASVSGGGSSTRPIVVTTSRAFVSGAPAGATFQWVFEDPTWDAVNPSSDSTSFRVNVSPGESATTVVYCAVTANGSTQNTNSIIASAQNYYQGVQP